MANEVSRMSTIGVQLQWGDSALTVAKAVRIKSFPDIGGEPEQVDLTDLEDEDPVYVPGVQGLSVLEFTANYTETDFDTVSSSAKEPLYYKLLFPDGGAYTWQGEHTVYVAGGGVNSPVKMHISVFPTTTPIFA